MHWVQASDVDAVGNDIEANTARGDSARVRPNQKRPQEEKFSEIQSNVLPVFFYNDMLVNELGQEIRLRLFEPRYQIMCRRMESNPRFLFMPNFEGYFCHVGDVGYVISLTHLEESPRSHTFGVAGRVTELAVVEATWVEPNTNDLHYAAVRTLDPSKEALSIAEVEMLRLQMLRKGWQQVYDELLPHQLLIRAPDQSSPAQVLFGLNWKLPPQIHLHLSSEGGSIDQALDVFQEAWVETVRSLPTHRRPQRTAADATALMHRVVHAHDQALGAAHVVNSAKSFVDLSRQSELAVRERRRGVAAGGTSKPQPLASLLNELEAMIAADDAAPGVLGLQTKGGSLPKGELIHVNLWRRLLQPVRVAALCSSPVTLNTARLCVFPDSTAAASDCLPFMRKSADSKFRGPCVQVYNGTNVHFYLPVDLVDVTAASSAAALNLVSSRLNGLRIAVIERARQRRTGGHLSALKDDVMKLVLEYLVVSLP
mmetsp:Transcript_29963/g.69700  ORF Transcript_29963/g.69700 Transcript_29963/m.69700 type:complete len:483 (-) Transcript_29963:12-1460(-)